MTRNFASLLPLFSIVLAVGCVRDAPIATEDGGARDGAARDGAQCIDCAQPPAGCEYLGGDGCTTCGTLVCADAGVDGGGCLSPVDCAQPPRGCEYSGGDGCTTCGTLVCEGLVCDATGEPFPPIGRECETSLDCTVVLHGIDCCGTARAIGIRDDHRGTFDDAERRCQDAFLPCDCIPQETSADDETVGDGVREVRVVCLDNLCTSTFRLGEGDECVPDAGGCGPGLACCYPCGVPGCEFRCEPTCDPSDPACSEGCLFRP